MGTDNYTKEEREFYESILQEIRSHQDFGKRNPVDIGIECGYSEDDVMGMIYMCQDIVGEKQTQQEPIPTRENWDLEGIIPFEDFVKTTFPKTLDFDHDIYMLLTDACRINGILVLPMQTALRYAKKMKRKSLKKLTDDNRLIINTAIKGFENLTKWMSLYAMVASTVFDSADIPIPISKEGKKAIMKLIKAERNTGKFHPIDMLVIKENGWDIDKQCNTDRE